MSTVTISSNDGARVELEAGALQALRSGLRGRLLTAGDDG